MTPITALDELCQIPFHDAAEAQRAQVLSRLADTELFVTLTAEPADDLAQLRIIGDEAFQFAVACDLQERLAAFWQGPVAYAAMPGRILARSLAAEGKGLFLNPDTPSEMLLEPETLAWLVQALEVAPDDVQITKQPPRLSAPAAEAVEALLAALSARAGDLTGLASGLALVGARWSDGRQGHLLLIQGTADATRDAIAKSFAELLSFLPQVKGGVDLGFLDADLPETAILIKVPSPAIKPEAPRRDPAAPPRLR